MRKFVVGCGYLGIRVAQKWLGQGDEVFALTRSHQNAEKLRAVSIEPIIGDVTQPTSLDGLSTIDDIQTVLYAVGFDRHASASMHEVYVAGLENILKAIAGRCERFLYISSTSVYGQTNGEWVDERAECQPTRENGLICLEAERLIHKYFPVDVAVSTATANILRLVGIYGPGRLIARVESLKAGEPLSGNPNGWLNLIHVDDAATAVLACEEQSKPGETYLICDDQPIRRRVYYETLATFISAPPPKFAETDAADTATQNLNKRCSNRKMHDELDVQLEFSDFSQGLAHALRAES